MNQVVNRNDSDESTLAVDHRHSADTIRWHLLNGLENTLIFRRAHLFPGHEISNCIHCQTSAAATTLDNIPVTDDPIRNLAARPTFPSLARNRP